MIYKEDPTMLAHSLDALRMTGIMAWEILWALCFGFLLSAVIEAVVSKAQLSKLLPDSSPRTILKASALGAASSSCSYAATALARTLFRKGADFIASMAFQFASTNLVIELSVLLCVVLGWQFMAAEFIGGPIMIAILVLLLRTFLRPRLIEAARAQANRGLAGRMEGHAAMDMSLHTGTFWQKISSRAGITATSHYYWMDWYSLIPDIALGLLISGILAAFVPTSFWQAFFLDRPPHPRPRLGSAHRPRWSPCSPSSAPSATSPSPPSSGTEASPSAASSASSSPTSSSSPSSTSTASTTASRSPPSSRSSSTSPWPPPPSPSKPSSPPSTSFPRTTKSR